MNCKKVQKLILTDYLDEELNSEQKSEIEAHIAGCQQCHQLEITAKKALVEPYIRLERALPQEKVWHKIKMEIQAEEKQKKSAFLFPKNVFAMITVFIAIVSITVMFVTFQKNNQEGLTVNTERQAENLAFLDDGINYYSSDVENISYGTEIEEYFL